MVGCFEFGPGWCWCGQGAVWGALKVLWLLPVTVLQCSQGAVAGAGQGVVSVLVVATGVACFGMQGAGQGSVWFAQGACSSCWQ